MIAKDIGVVVVRILRFDPPREYVYGGTDNYCTRIERLDGSIVSTGRGFEKYSDAKLYGDGLYSGLRLTQKPVGYVDDTLPVIDQEVSIPCTA